jgi:hypothetical protein
LKENSIGAGRLEGEGEKLSKVGDEGSEGRMLEAGWWELKKMFSCWVKVSWSVGRGKAHTR